MRPHHNLLLLRLPMMQRCRKRLIMLLMLHLLLDLVVGWDL